MSPIRVALRTRPLRLEVSTAAAVAASAPPPTPVSGAARVKHLLAQDGLVDHWAHDYADRLVRRVAPDEAVLIQTSMSPSGFFHVGNFRDTVTAHLVARAVRARRRRARVLLSFDDFDPFRALPELGPLASRPMADAAERSAEVCRAYVAELKAVGICPAHADDDGRTTPGSDWETHYQAERYRAGLYLDRQRRFIAERARLADLLGARHPDRLFTPYCGQCGRNTTVVTALSRRGVGYVCRTCDARIESADLRELKPAWAVDWVLRVAHEGIDCEPAGHDHCVAGSTMDRTGAVFGALVDRPQPVIVPYGLVRQFDDHGKISGSRGGGLRVTDLLTVMPARMVLWLYGRVNCRYDIRIALDLASLNRWYVDYDAFGRAAVHDTRARALWELLTDDPPLCCHQPLPSFRRLAGVVQSHLFDLPAAEKALRSAGFGDADHAALRERLVLARNWLSTWGRDRCWLPPEPSTEPPPCRFLLQRLPGADSLLCRHRPEEYHAIAYALFGTRTGPPLSRVVERSGPEAVADALAAFAEDGSRPLRDELQARLVNREEPPWE